MQQYCCNLDSCRLLLPKDLAQGGEEGEGSAARQFARSTVVSLVVHKELETLLCSGLNCAGGLSAHGETV